MSEWRNRFLVVFLAIQAVLPLWYYVRHDDPYDERFAWRMFSDVRLLSCDARFSVDQKPVNTDLHEAWTNLLHRGRESVALAAAHRLCQDHPGSAVTMTFQCHQIDGATTTLMNGDRDLCK